MGRNGDIGIHPLVESKPDFAVQDGGHDVGEAPATVKEECGPAAVGRFEDAQAMEIAQQRERRESKEKGEQHAEKHGGIRWREGRGEPHIVWPFIPPDWRIGQRPPKRVGLIGNVRYQGGP